MIDYPNSVEASLTSVLRESARRLGAGSRAEVEPFFTTIADTRLPNGWVSDFRHGYGPE